MSGDVQVRFCERPGVKLPWATHLVVLCRDEAEAQRVLDTIRQWVEQVGLTLHPTKTRLVNLNQVGEGFDFLGYHFERGRRGKCWRGPRTKSEKNFREEVREHTRRTNGDSLEKIIEKLNPKLRGFFEYFKQSYAAALVRLDKWVRMRLRSILRKRHHGRGRGHGSDHWRWPNAFFGAHGLFSMAGARAKLVQSSPR